MDVIQQGLLVAALSGATAFIKTMFSKKVRGYVTVGVTVALGALAGFGGVDGLTPITGILTAFAALGITNWVDRSSSQK